MRAPRAPWLALLLAACTLPARRSDETGTQVNSCTTEGEEGGACGLEGVCLRGLCRAREADEIPVVFEITRSQVSGVDPGQTLHIFAASTLAKLRALDQQGGRLDLGLPPLVSLDVQLLGPDPEKTTPPPSARGCAFLDQAQNRTLPLHTTLRPSASQRGLQIATLGQNASDPNKLTPPLNLKTSFLVPPATYDIYLRPSGDPACPIPPILRLNTPILDPVNILSTELPPTSRIQGTAVADPGLDLSSWSVQIVEPLTGLRVSTTAGLLPTGGGQWTIGVPYTSTAGKPSIAPLEYYRPTGPTGAPTGSLFLVLSPPSGTTAPRFAWNLSTLDLFGSGQISLDLGGLALGTVDVDLRAELGDGPAGQKAQIWMASDLTPGALASAPPGALASFAVGPLLSKEDGTLSLRLVPGLYRGSAVAATLEPLDIGRKLLDFHPDPAAPGARLAGFTLGIPPRPSLDVPILTATSDAPLPGLAFSLVPSSRQQPSFSTLFGLSDLAPRGAAGLTDDDGHLRASADSGDYDLTVQFPLSSGFPWLVKPRVTLPLTSPGALRVSSPIEVNGTVYDLPLDNKNKRPLVGSWMRVYALVDGAYVLIGASSVDPAGAYRLLLPSRL